MAAFACKVDQGSQLAEKLNAEAAFFRHEPDLFNELTDAVCSFRAGSFIIQGFAQVGDFSSVYLGEIRMESRHGWRR